MSYLFTNIGKIFGLQPQGKNILKGTEMATVHQMDNAFIYVSEGKIQEVGSMAELPESLKANSPVINFEGDNLMPSFVDSHTHIVFAQPRTAEYVMRIQGKTYEEIAAAGGGILNSAQTLAHTSEEELFEGALLRLNEVAKTGTGAIEIKSGYGLSPESERKMLRVIRRLKEVSPHPIWATYLGAHAIPAPFKPEREKYIQQVIDEIPFLASEGLADFFDVFCDAGYFNPQETEQILEAGYRHGLKAKIHANELAISGGVQVAVKMNALSCDHLERIGPEEIAALQAGSTIPVSLPGTSFFLGIPYTPSRQIIEAGLPLAIASDFNPGSCPSGNMQFCWALACSQQKLLPEEAFNALTLNAAATLDFHAEAGSITVGKRADFIRLQPEKTLSAYPYYFGRNAVKQLYLAGKLRLIN